MKLAGLVLVYLVLILVILFLGDFIITEGIVVARPVLKIMGGFVVISWVVILLIGRELHGTSQNDVGTVR